MLTEGLSFTAFVVSLASTAAIHFGDMPDPVSGEQGEPNLQGAAQMIEILSLLEQKTKGNLTAEERQVLEQVLYELRLRFVQVTSGAKRIVEP
ncbi:MAG: DUF1844 domain-containing protein [Acidobacteria bacterium]|nr:MAG: DUF1844 domain-containing protein [Acidobacteriota bacterium]